MASSSVGVRCHGGVHGDLVHLNFEHLADPGGTLRGPECVGENDEGVSSLGRVCGHAVQELAVAGVDVQARVCHVALGCPDDPYPPQTASMSIRWSAGAMIVCPRWTSHCLNVAITCVSLRTATGGSSATGSRRRRMAAKSSSCSGEAALRHRRRGPGRRRSCSKESLLVPIEVVSSDEPAVQ